MQTVENKKVETKEFSRRLDFYWQFISVYTIALVAYTIMRGTIVDDTITVALYDPVSLLFAAFILGTSFGLLYQFIKKRSIIIEPDSITLVTRTRVKKYGFDQIRRISLSKDRRVRVKKPVRIIKIRLAGRRFPLRIRPSAYWDDGELVRMIMVLKKNQKDYKAKIQK